MNKMMLAKTLAVCLVVSGMAANTTTHSTDARAAAVAASATTPMVAKPPVGKWGMVFAGLQGARDHQKEMYQMGYQEIVFSAKGTYLWSGWTWGNEFKKSGVWYREKDRIVMEDKKMLFESRKGTKDMIWYDKTYAVLTKAESGYYKLEPTAPAGMRVFWLGVRYDLTKKPPGYFNQAGERLNFKY
ncbi:MAG: hypothetical protein AAB774_00780 [Patescibacteria group bacterium]